tara:strand:+ start:20209 stop:21798 length:1590 start_codon:yes stop_codon:yes gene_type:complete
MKGVHMTQAIDHGFGRWRAIFWPIHKYELKKLIPMLLIAFCIAFVYTILRDTKDTIVVSAIDELALPFLKLFGTLPAAILFMLIYSKLSNKLSKESLFYVIIVPFLIFFGIFAFVLYPNREVLQPTATAQYLLSISPEGFYSAIKCFEHWTLSLFYILSELWGSAVLSLLFWGFANEIVKTNEAKRFYTLFTMGFNLALIFSGPLIWYSSVYGKSLAGTGVDTWQVTLNYLMTLVMVAGVTIVACYWWMNRNVLTDKQLYDPESNPTKAKKSKHKMGVIEGLVYLSKSKYLLCIALLVIGYGMSINLVEVVWKGQLKLAYPNKNDYSAFMGMFSMSTGIFTIAMTFVGGYIIRTRSWGRAASLTPMALLITGIGFFVFIVFRDYMVGYIAFIGTTPVMMAVIIGMVQNIASKSTKYSLFDPTKEMAYIPLDDESKVKGKAAIDVVGARAGKSGGALIWNFLAITLVSVFGKDIGKAIATPIVAVLMIGIIMAWLWAVRSLNKQYNELTGEPDELEANPKVRASTVIIKA